MKPIFSAQKCEKIFLFMMYQLNHFENYSYFILFFTFLSVPWWLHQGTDVLFRGTGVDWIRGAYTHCCAGVIYCPLLWALAVPSINHHVLFHDTLFRYTCSLISDSRDSIFNLKLHLWKKHPVWFTHSILDFFVLFFTIKDFFWNFPNIYQLYNCINRKSK